MAKTTRADALYLLQRFAEATQTWRAGDACLSYNGREQTTVVSVANSIVTLANGDAMHTSKMRSVR